MRQSLSEQIKQLPPDLQQEVRDFVEFLLEKRVKQAQKQNELKLDWRGALQELRDEYTSVELQHRSLQWWSD